MKDLFSSQAGYYAKYRPHYPDELFAFLFSLVKEKHKAWDAGCGNGQVSVQLARAFEKVIATDISAQQLSHAATQPNISYHVSAEEAPFIQNHSIDLITVGTALHWFDFEKFYAEVKRVAKPGAVIAAWAYNLMRVNNAIDPILEDFCYVQLKNYWDKERKYVDEEYKNISFPFEEVETPSFFIRAKWDLEHVEGYLNSWSAVRHYIDKHQSNPVVEIAEKLKAHWKGDVAVSFPLHIRVGRL